MDHRKCAVFVGTYTEPILFGTGQILQGKGEGIYRFWLNLSDGSLQSAGEPCHTFNPSYLALSNRRETLYAVNELKKFDGGDQGAVSAFRVDRQDLSLHFMNQRPTGGADPCHVAVDSGDRCVFVSNYMSGSVCAFPVAQDGALGDASQFIQHHGSSVHPERQAGPHAHSLTFSPDETYAFVPDLGMDKLKIYKTDLRRGMLQPGAPDAFDTVPGSGPRQCVFHPNGRFCYLICEIEQTVNTLTWDESTGTLCKIQTVPTVVDAFEGENTGADIHITPDGRFVYGSNRGKNTLIAYRADPASGLLTYVDTFDCGGKIPRSFAIDPTGQFILVCNQDSDNLVVFRIDTETGALSRLNEIAVPTPVCVKPYLW